MKLHGLDVGAVQWTSLALLAFCVASCGGEGSSGGNTPIATSPKFTSSATVSVKENTSEAFYRATASDPQNDPIIISVYSGPDAGHFVIDGSGNLKFNTPPNYDRPTDADRNNVYEVNLRATAAGQATNLTLNVTVLNDREGIAVTQVADGIVDPVGISFVHSQPTLLVAERGGRVLAIDPQNGTITEDTFIRDNRLPGENLAIVFGFPDNPYQEAIYLLTHSATDGLYLQAFDSAHGKATAIKLGDPYSGLVQASMTAQRTVLIAIGDPSGDNAQSTASPYGKLIELPLYDIYSGASLPPADEVVLRPRTIGDGIQKPGGFSVDSDRILLADQGTSVEHDITIFQPEWRPLDFGWPFYEGAQSIRTNPPAAVNGPTIVYPFGNEARQGTGVIAGLLNDYRYFPSLGDIYVFADTNGTIWTVGRDKLYDGYRHGASEFEVRTEDFKPDRGAIDSPVGFAIGYGTSHFYILDKDGQLFAVREAE